VAVSEKKDQPALRNASGADLCGFFYVRSRLGLDPLQQLHRLSEVSFRR
jgi:hypothetical protein